MIQRINTARMRGFLQILILVVGSCFHPLWAQTSGTNLDLNFDANKSFQSYGNRTIGELEIIAGQTEEPSFFVLYIPGEFNTSSIKFSATQSFGTALKTTNYTLFTQKYDGYEVYTIDLKTNANAGNEVGAVILEDIYTPLGDFCDPEKDYNFYVEQYNGSSDNLSEATFKAAPAAPSVYQVQALTEPVPNVNVSLESDKNLEIDAAAPGYLIFRVDHYNTGYNSFDITFDLGDNLCLGIVQPYDHNGSYSGWANGRRSGEYIREQYNFVDLGDGKYKLENLSPGNWSNDSYFKVYFKPTTSNTALTINPVVDLEFQGDLSYCSSVTSKHPAPFPRSPEIWQEPLVLNNPPTTLRATLTSQLFNADKNGCSESDGYFPLIFNNVFTGIDQSLSFDLKNDNTNQFYVNRLAINNTNSTSGYQLSDFNYNINNDGYTGTLDGLAAQLQSLKEQEIAITNIKVSSASIFPSKDYITFYVYFESRGSNTSGIISVKSSTWTSVQNQSVGLDINLSEVNINDNLYQTELNTNGTFKGLEQDVNNYPVIQPDKEYYVWHRIDLDNYNENTNLTNLSYEYELDAPLNYVEGDLLVAMSSVSTPRLADYKPLSEIQQTDLADLWHLAQIENLLTVSPGEDGKTKLLFQGIQHTANTCEEDYYIHLLFKVKGNYNGQSNQNYENNFTINQRTGIETENLDNDNESYDFRLVNTLNFSLTPQVSCGSTTYNKTAIIYPGDPVYQTISFENKGTEELKDIILIAALPEGPSTKKLLNPQQTLGGDFSLIGMSGEKVVKVDFSGNEQDIPKGDYILEFSSSRHVCYAETGNISWADNFPFTQVNPDCDEDAEFTSVPDASTRYVRLRYTGTTGLLGGQRLELRYHTTVPENLDTEEELSASISSFAQATRKSGEKLLIFDDGTNELERFNEIKTGFNICHPEPPAPHLESQFSVVATCVNNNVVLEALVDADEYVWSLGNGEPDVTGKKVSLTYPESGRFTISLTVTKTGFADFPNVTLTDSKSQTVQVGAPETYFIAEDACSGSELSLRKITDGADKYNWTIYESGTSRPETPTYQFKSPIHKFGEDAIGKTYTLHLKTVFNSQNNDPACESEYEQDIYVGAPVSAQATVPYATCVGSPILFDGEEYQSQDPELEVAHSWDFGDGSGSGRIDIEHVYEEVGEYYPEFTVSSGACEAKYRRIVTVDPPAEVEIIAEQAYVCLDRNKPEEGASTPVMLKAKITNLSSMSPPDFEWYYATEPGMIEKGEGELLGRGINQGITQPGFYGVIVTNSCGSSLPSITEITEEYLPEITTINSGIVSCPGMSDATATATVNLYEEETPNTYAYRWNGAQNYVLGQTESPAILAEGENYLDVKHTLTGCYVRKNFEVAPSQTTLNVTESLIGCKDEETEGQLSAQVSDNGTNVSGYSYYWTSQQSGIKSPASNTIQGGPGLYDVQAEKELPNGKTCILEKNSIALHKAIPAVHVSNGSQLIACDGNSSGNTIHIEAEAWYYQGASSSQPDFSFQLKDQNNNTITPTDITPANTQTAASGNKTTILEIPSPTAAAEYTLEATYNGCTATTPVTIAQVSQPLQATIEITQPQCESNTGKLTAIGTGGHGDLSYTWYQTGNSTSFDHGAILDEVPVGNYEIEITDSRENCAPVTAQATITLPDPISISWINSETGEKGLHKYTGCKAEVNVETNGKNYQISWLKQESTEVTQLTENTEGEYDIVRDAEDKPVTATETNWRPVLNTENNTIASGLPKGRYKAILTTEDGCTVETTTPFSAAELENDLSWQAAVLGRQTDKNIKFTYTWQRTRPYTPTEPETLPLNYEIEDLVFRAAEELNSFAAKCIINNEGQSIAVKDLCYDPSLYSDKVNVYSPFYDGQHTLYYYDRAGNLTRTVPPEGVDYLDVQSELNPTLAYRNEGPESGESLHYPEHRMATRYYYNSLKQLIRQATPDGGETRFMYNDNTQLRFSQNARQEAEGTFSYTKYDQLGRVAEVGEADLASVGAAGLNDLRFYKNQITGNPTDAFPTLNRRDVTYTYYNTAREGIKYQGRPQENLTNNVSYVIRDKDANLETTHDQTLTAYSYDTHENVQWMVQQIPGMGENTVAYSYDLVSGNVQEVAYNATRPEDRLYHRYSYDADNRIQTVETSRNHWQWDKDAEYEYYAHGPLKTVHIGEDNIQDLEYYYTIHGWLKAINATSLDGTEDMTVSAQTHETLKDVFAMSLGYYKGDYKTTGSNNTGLEVLSAQITATSADTEDQEGTYDHYNGNIGAWLSQTNSVDVMSAGFADHGDRILKVYDYDLLNRIKSSNVYTVGTTETMDQSWKNTQPQNSDKYATTYRYDKNGNIDNPSVIDGQALTRKDAEGITLDALNYIYERDANGHKINNRLQRVEETGTGADNHNNQQSIGGIHNYNYDEIGNLIEETYYLNQQTAGNDTPDNTADDVFETRHITSQIQWDVYGKIEQVTITERDGTAEGAITNAKQLRFAYDAGGNRIEKSLYHGTTEPAPYPETSTFYVRDASGNIMAVYERKIETIENSTGYTVSLSLKEQPIYGSDRLGQYTFTSENRIYEKNLSEVSPETLAALNYEYQLPQGSTGSTNWMTNTSETGENGLCRFNIRQSANTGAADLDYGNAAGLIDASFPGQISNGIALCEDQDGQLQFYAAVAEKYMGKTDQVLVFNKEGKLMKGSMDEAIKADPAAKPVIMRQGQAEGNYYLITTGKDRNIYYHAVDMTQNGYKNIPGIIDPAQVNQVLDTRGHYGKHLAVIEDQLKNRYILYMTRYREPEVPNEPGIIEILYQPGHNRRTKHPGNPGHPVQF